MRVVSLCPSLTELVFDLGGGADLVGRTRYCVEPRGRIEVVPEVGGTKNPKIEEILRLRPSLVLMNREENRQEDADALASTGLDCRVYYPRSVEDSAVMVRQVAEALHRRTAGDRIAAEIEAELRAAQTYAFASRLCRWAYLIWRKPWMAVNGDTYIHALLSAAGGENVFADKSERYPAVAAEELCDAAPDLILLSSEPFPFAESHADELAEATGLERERFVLVDGQDLSWHGSRTRRGLQAAVAAFSSVVPGAEKVRCS